MPASDAPHDLEFFFDPACPWAYVTSRWVLEVQRLRNYSVVWRFISLKVINEFRADDPGYISSYHHSHTAGLRSLRVADEVRLRYDNDAVISFYTAVSDFIHRDKRRAEIEADPVAALAGLAASVGLPSNLGEAALDETHDAHIRAESALAHERTGKDVGTPILTFHPGQHNENSFFGPVIASIPRGDAAVKLWDAVETLATTSGVCELKRSNRFSLNFD